jgi:hypothetical protein
MHVWIIRCVQSAEWGDDERTLFVAGTLRSALAEVKLQYENEFYTERWIMSDEDLDKAETDEHIYVNDVDIATYFSRERVGYLTPDQYSIMATCEDCIGLQHLQS